MKEHYVLVEYDNGHRTWFRFAGPVTANGYAKLKQLQSHVKLARAVS